MTRGQEKQGPGVGNLLLGYALLGAQPLPVAVLARSGIGAAETVCVRFVLSACFLVFICAARRRGLSTAQPKILMLRGILGGAAVLLYFTSIQLSGAARGTLLNYTYPIWANLFAWLLGQRVDRSFWIGLAVALVGVWFVVVPSAGLGVAGIGAGEIAGLCSAFLAGGAVLTIKELRHTDESLTIIAAFTLGGLLMSLPLSDVTSLTRALSPALLLPTLSVGLLAFFGHVFFTRGYRGVSVQDATLLSLTVPLIATLSGILLLDEPLTLRFALGGILIIGSSLLTLRKRENSKVAKWGT